MRDVWQIIHKARTIDHVRVRIGTVQAREFWELERALKGVDFAPYLAHGRVSVRSVSEGPRAHLEMPRARRF